MAEQQQRPITITLSAVMNGFPIEICFDGTIDQLPRITQRLAELGAEAPSAAVVAAPSKPKVEKVTPTYDGNGDPCCPVHRRVLSEGQYGLYCSAKAKGDQVADKRGYCGLKFQD